MHRKWVREEQKSPVDGYRLYSYFFLILLIFLNIKIGLSFRSTYIEQMTNSNSRLIRYMS